jgi:hypothetical protein
MAKHLRDAVDDCYKRRSELTELDRIFIESATEMSEYELNSSASRIMGIHKSLINNLSKEKE